MESGSHSSACKSQNSESCSDFRPISITPVLSRVMEKIVVRDFIYPAILSPSPKLSFADQFAFRLSGTTTAALIYLLEKITNLLETNTHVFVYAFDFSKAFDTVKHITLFEKFAELPLPAHIHNWLADFFSNRLHCTSLDGLVSKLKEITASIIQGSGLGPASYSVNASTCIRSIFPFNGEVCRRHVLDRSWQKRSYQNRGNRKCSKLGYRKQPPSEPFEVGRNYFHKTEVEPNCKKQSSAPSSWNSRVSSIKILGVTISENLSVSDHVRATIGSCAQSL